MTFLETHLRTYYEHIAEVFISIGHYIQLKIAGGAILLVYGFFFDISSAKMMLSLFFLVTFDLISGVAVAKKTGMLIESKKLAKSAFKLGVYGMLVSAMHLTDYTMHLTTMSVNLEVGMMAFLAATEGVSLIENAGRLGFAIPQKLLNSLTEFTQKSTTIIKNNKNE